MNSELELKEVTGSAIPANRVAWHYSDKVTSETYIDFCVTLAGGTPVLKIKKGPNAGRTFAITFDSIENMLQKLLNEKL